MQQHLSLAGTIQPTQQTDDNVASGNSDNPPAIPNFPQEIHITSIEEDAHSHDPNTMEYDSGEHRDIGNLVFHYFLSDLEQTNKDLHKRLVAKLIKENKQTKLYDPLRSDGKAIKVTLYRLRVSEQLTLNAGEIVALAGDFIGVPDRPIAFGISDDDQEQRFEEAFNKIKQTEEHQLEVISNLLDAINGPTKNGQGCMHGGGWSLKFIKNALDTMKYDRIMKPPKHLRGKIKDDSYSKLLLTNFDHFGEEAKQAYLAGHRKALSKAREAAKLEADTTEAQNQQIDLLLTAVLMELFACHFLTDLFAAGHVRTPRKELVNFLANPQGIVQASATQDVSTSSTSTAATTSAPAAGINRIPDLNTVSSLNLAIAGLFANRMHDEDGKNGVWVNAIREGNESKWNAKGDGYYGATRNKENAQKACETMLVALNDIFLRFTKKHTLLSTLDKLDSYVPHAVSRQDDPKQPVPMFFVPPGTDEVVYRNTILQKILTEGWGKGVQSAVVCVPKNFGFVMTRLFNVKVVPAAAAAKEAAQEAATQTAEQVQALYDNCQAAGIGCPIQ